MADPADTTTTLNPGVGGDAMDESLVYQSDGATQAKRPRVDLGFQSDDRPGANPLVSSGSPLPVSDNSTEFRQMCRDIHEIKELLQMLLLEMDM